MSQEIGVVLLGYGLAGKVFHGPLIKATDGLRIDAVVTNNAERIEQVRQDFPRARIYPTTDAALSECPDASLVVVANANRAHVADATKAMDSGRHVVVDKPLAGSEAEALLLAKTASARGVQLHTFQNRRWDSDFLTLLSFKETGELGTLHRFESRFERLRTIPKGNWRELAAPDELGGVLLDFGAHLVDQALELLGSVASVDAYARSIRQSDGADDDMQIILTHTSGALSVLIGSQVSAFPDPRFMLLGSQGAIRIAQGDSQESLLRAGAIPNSSDWGTETITAEVSIGHADGTMSSRKLPLSRGLWPNFYAAVRDSILDNSPAPVPLNDVIANLRVLDAARTSASTSQRVLLDSPASHE
jgi:predicted dehydrogenase